MGVVPGHEDDEDDPHEPEDRLRFTKTPFVRVRPPPLIGGPLIPSMRVREPRRATTGGLQASPGVPVPETEATLPNVEGVPFPGIPDPAGVAMRPLFDLMNVSAGYVSPRWVPSRPQVRELFAKIGQETEGRVNTIAAMAEDASAEAFSRFDPYGQWLPAAFIPLLKHLFRGRAARAAAASGVDIYRRFRVHEGVPPKQGLGKGTRPQVASSYGRGVAPFQPRGSFGVLQVNANQWMRELVKGPGRRRESFD